MSKLNWNTIKKCVNAKCKHHNSYLTEGCSKEKGFSVFSCSESILTSKDDVMFEEDHQYIDRLRLFLWFRSKCRFRIATNKPGYPVCACNEECEFSTEEKRECSLKCCPSLKNLLGE